MVRPTWNRRSRSRKSSSGNRPETTFQAAAVGGSSSDTQPRGTARRGCVSLSSETASPDIAAYAAAVVLISGAMGPSVSSDLLSGITPAMSMLPNAGLNPAAPQSDPGMRIEPPVSLPIAELHIPAATATVDPPEEPAATLYGSRGFRNVPKFVLTLVTTYSLSCSLVLPSFFQLACVI